MMAPYRYVAAMGVVWQVPRLDYLGVRKPHIFTHNGVWVVKSVLGKVDLQASFKARQYCIKLNHMNLVRKPTES